MKSTWVCLLLVLSIALQSYAAVANSDENHQVDTQHLQTEHSHDVDNIELVADSSKDKHNIKDCHHCGHCQGSHTQWFTSEKSYFTTPDFIITNQYFYSNHLAKSIIEEPFRPPIA